MGIRKECQGERERKGWVLNAKSARGKSSSPKMEGEGHRGKGKKKEREFMYTSLCVRVKERVNRLFVIKRVVYFLGA